jgi:DNA polymerase III alpha subunit
MKHDKYSNPIFDQDDVFNLIYQNYKFSVDNTLLVEKRTDDIKQLETQLGFKFLEPYETHFEISDYDKACQSNWNMPEEYKLYDIVDWLYSQCKTSEQKDRVTEELKAFAERDMIMLLKWLKYFVDTCRKNNIVWGVGRGSSVSSYVLYIIGVHKIDPLRYNLDWQDFLR